MKLTALHPLRLLSLLALTASLSTSAWGQSATQRWPVTSQQRSMAQQVAQAGVPLSALAADAPDEYTVRRGDTLWGISGVFLRHPWRWPELWGMNLQDIKNPHLIYPGQQLFLERRDGRAFLRTSKGQGDDLRTIRVSPRNRVQMLDASPLSTLDFYLIEPFLAEPIVMADEQTFENAPRIIGLANPDRVLVAKNDRAYAIGPRDAPLLSAPGLPHDFRIFHTTQTLRDPETGEILGYEGQYVGQARLIRGESETVEPWEDPNAMEPDNSGEHWPPEQNLPQYLPVAATVDIIQSKEEIRKGDRLLPEPESQYLNYVPHAPDLPVNAHVVSIYSSNAARFAGGNQVVAINKGLRDGMQAGQVLAVLSSGRQVNEKINHRRELIQLPDELNGLGMVFKTFERVSYVLIMGVENPVEVGDRLVNPD